MVEQWPFKPLVQGSSPCRPTRSRCLLWAEVCWMETSPQVGGCKKRLGIRCLTAWVVFC